MFRNPKSLTGLAILGVFVLIAVFGNIIAPYGPLEKDYTALRQGPSSAHWLGTTHMGEDVFSQIVYGTRGVLVVGFTAGIIATFVAVVIGVVAGYTRGWRSESLSAVTNVFLVIPGLPLIIIVASQYQNPPLIVIAAVLAFTGWAWGARVLRAQTMSLRNRDFIQAARANGEPLRRIIFVEMLPNLMAIIASSFVGTVTAAVLGLTTLAFIGVIPISNLNWGTILFWAQQNGAFPTYWWWWLPAGLCIAILGVALSLINFGIDEYVNPRLRSAGEQSRALRKRGIDANSSVTTVRIAAPPDQPTTTRTEGDS
nr:ABC transporter permease [Serinibacter salmoneus]